MTRTGLFRYIRISHLDEAMACGWLPVADLGPNHGQWSVLCWHCGCSEILEAREQQKGAK